MTEESQTGRVGRAARDRAAAWRANLNRVVAVVAGLLIGGLLGSQLPACRGPQLDPDVPRARGGPVVPPAEAARPELFGEVTIDRGGARHHVLRAFSDPTGHAPFQRGSWARGPGSDEEQQSFPDYRDSGPIQADGQYRAIVLQPLGPFDEQGKRELALLREYTEAFFRLPCELQESIPLPEARQRRGYRGQTQHHTRTIMDGVLLPRLPEHALCYLGVTLGDLYPSASWNYVFGQAYLFRRVGVYSLARHRAAFWGDPTTAATRRRALRRACKVLAHETGHMFGMPHCLAFSCAMNGSNSLEESDRHPLWLCPVCVSKLVWNRAADPVARYRDLAAFFRKVELPDAAAWYDAAVRRVEATR